ncbi:MAG: hypothetical protein ACI4UA_02640 [Bacteroidaceae bacterium]
MEKYRIGIVPTPGDDAVMMITIASMEEPQMTDLVVPVLYADRNRVEQMRNGQNSDTQFVYLTHAEDAREECVCVVDTTRRNARNPQEDAPGMDVWTEDLQNGNVDALVMVGDTDTEKLDGQVKMYLSERNCMAMLHRDSLAEDMQQVVALLERDLDSTKPRMAVVADTDKQKEEWEAKAEEMGAFVYGPFLTETFFEEEHYRDFDVLMALDAQSAMRGFRETAHTWGVCLTEDDEQHVILYPAYNNESASEESAEFSSVSLNHALYLAVDILRNRKRYDEAHENPLPKLFFEKKDERKGSVE